MVARLFFLASALRLASLHAPSGDGHDLRPTHYAPEYVSPAAAVALAATARASKARPLLLIHIPKTGGASVVETLGLAVVKDGQIDVDYAGTAECQGVPVVAQKHGDHDTAMRAKTFYTDVEWEQSYVFAFVRNPWERFVSEFTLKYDEYVSACGCEPLSQDALANASHPEDDLVQYCTLDFYLAHLKDCGAAHYYRVRTTQTEFLTDADGAMLVNFVGRQENLQTHLMMALLAAGNNATLSAACAASLLSDTHGSDHAYYAEYYETGSSIHNSLFEGDARAFNYSFDAPPPLDVVSTRAARPIFGRSW